MKLRLIDFTEMHAKEICYWRYDGIYSIYNYPDWNKVINQKWAITIDVKRQTEFSAIVDNKNNLCGYIRLSKKNEKILVGIGLKPSLCGKGLGSVLMEILIERCRKIYPKEKIVLEVRSFNKRAIKCYEKAGFKVVGIYEKDTSIGHGEFIRMEFSD